LGLPAEKFFVSENTVAVFAARKEECRKKYLAWLEMFDEWQHRNPGLVQKLSQCETTSVVDTLSSMEELKGGGISTRVASGKILQKIAECTEFIVTGSADLFSSTGNYIKEAGDFSSENLKGRNIYFGVREHAMAAFANGISYDGMFRPSCSTFLVFSDYMRAAIRMAALAKLGTIFILTHDSIAVGEDGPTHQPVETIAALRCIPNLDVVRPADYEETIGAWQLAMANTNRPTALILSRQDLPLLDGIAVTRRRNSVAKGAYIAHKESGQLQRIILTSGSELHLALQVANLFKGTRVVSFPCMEAFERQSNEYKNMVCPEDCAKRIAIEAGIAMPWYKYVGENGVIIGVNNFGYSGQAIDLMNSFGITLENLKNTVQKLN
jgi:transketolase